MADGDFVTGMVVGGGSSRTANSWKETAAQWQKAAQAHELAGHETTALLFGIFDVLKTFPVEARVQILTSLRESLAPAVRDRFGKRGLKPAKATERAAEFIEQLEAAWSKTAAASQDARSRRPRF